jgi:Protein of unknown function (DUF3137)
MAAVLSETSVGGADDRLSSLFQLQVVPDLANLERRRRQHRFLYVSMVAGMLAAIFLMFLLVQDRHNALLAAGVALAIGFLVLQWIQRSYVSQVRRTVMPAVCSAIGDVSHSTGTAPDLNLEGLARIGLVPRHHRRSIDDVFCGRHRATGFTMAEVRLRRRSGRRSSRTVYRGLIFAIEVPRAVPARILIARDRGLIGNRLKGWIVKSFGGMQRVKLPDQAFEARFELYTDHPEVARTVLTPELCGNLVALVAAHDGARFQAAFADGRFFLAMPRRGDLFRAGSLFRSTDELEGEAARLLQEVQIVHRLIDYLHGDRPPLQPDAVEPEDDQGDVEAPGAVVRC